MAVNRQLLGEGGLDRAGVMVSGICALHCVICALLPAAFGVLGLGVLSGTSAEWCFTIMAIVCAAGALVFGWSRHRSRGIALLIVVAVAGLLVARGLEGHEGHHAHHEACLVVSAEPHDTRGLAGTALGVFAGLMLLTGHMLNMRALRRCGDAGC